LRLSSAKSKEEEDLKEGSSTGRSLRNSERKKKGMTTQEMKAKQAKQQIINLNNNSKA